jgi:hypothetical protein
MRSDVIRLREAIEHRIRQLESIDAIAGDFIHPVKSTNSKEEQRRAETGLLHLWSALQHFRLAREASDEDMLLRWMYAESLFNAGRRAYVESRIRTDRACTAGKARGASIREQAAKAWAPWEAEYHQLAIGKDHSGRLAARNAVVNKMKRAEFVDPLSGSWRERKTIARHFPAK